MDHAVGSERQQGLDVVRSCDPEGPAEAGQLAGIAADLIRIGDEEPDQFEAGVRGDPGQGMSPHVAGTPLDDTVGHGVPFCFAGIA
jgi:hypothetical protein